MKFKIPILIAILISFQIVCFSNNTQLDSLQSAYENTRVDTEKIALLSKIAWKYNTHDPEKFHELTEEILDRSRAINYEDGIGMAYSYFGTYHYLKDEYLKALDNFENALKIFQRTKNKKKIASIYNQKGLLLQSFNQPEKAIEEYLNSLSLKEEINDKRGMANTLNNLGILYLNNHKLVKAKSFFEKALLIYLELNERDGISDSYNNIGIIHFNKMEYDKAIEYYLKSLKLEEQIENNKYGLASSYNNLGGVYSEIGKHEVANYYFEMALPLYKESKSKTGLYLVNYNMAESRIKTKNFKAAIQLATNSLLLAKEVQSNSNLCDSYDLLYKAYNELGDYKNALRNKEFHAKLIDSIKLVEKKVELAALELQHKYESKKLKSSIEHSELIKKENEKLKLKVIYILFAILGVLMTIAFLKPSAFGFTFTKGILLASGLSFFNIASIQIPKTLPLPYDQLPVNFAFHSLLIVILTLIYLKVYNLFSSKKKELTA